MAVCSGGRRKHYPLDPITSRGFGDDVSCCDIKAKVKCRILDAFLHAHQRSYVDYDLRARSVNICFCKNNSANIKLFKMETWMMPHPIQIFLSSRPEIVNTSHRMSGS